MNTSFNGIRANYAPGGLYQWEPQGNTGLNWQKLEDISVYNGFYQETYFDTSGYTRDYLTTYPIEAFVQQPGRVQISGPGTVRLYSFDIISTERLDVGDLVVGFNDENALPSFPLGPTQEWEQTMYGRFQQFLGANQGPDVGDVFVRVADDDFGSLEPTTADKLWVYKIWLITGLPSDPGSIMLLPNSRTILRVDVRKEDDLPFLMRQKRSYELTNY